jgi:hypothetical protein
MTTLLKFAAVMALGIALAILLALAGSFLIGSAYVLFVKRGALISTSGYLILPWTHGRDGLAFSALGFAIGGLLGMLTWKPIWIAGSRFR